MIYLFQIDDDVEEDEDASFYQRTNKKLPNTQKTRIVGNDEYEGQKLDFTQQDLINQPEDDEEDEEEEDAHVRSAPNLIDLLIEEDEEEVIDHPEA